jgi:hypothetical protein
MPTPQVPGTWRRFASSRNLRASQVAREFGASGASRVAREVGTSWDRASPDHRPTFRHLWWPASSPRRFPGLVVTGIVTAQVPGTCRVGPGPTPQVPGTWRRFASSRNLGPRGMPVRSGPRGIGPAPVIAHRGRPRQTRPYVPYRPYPGCLGRAGWCRCWSPPRTYRSWGVPGKTAHHRCSGRPTPRHRGHPSSSRRRTAAPSAHRAGRRPRFTGMQPDSTATCDGPNGLDSDREAGRARSAGFAVTLGVVCGGRWGWRGRPSRGRGTGARRARRARGADPPTGSRLFVHRSSAASRGYPRTGRARERPRAPPDVLGCRPNRPHRGEPGE